MVGGLGAGHSLSGCRTFPVISLTQHFSDPFSFVAVWLTLHKGIINGQSSGEGKEEKKKERQGERMTEERRWRGKKEEKEEREDR